MTVERELQNAKNEIKRQQKKIEELRGIAQERAAIIDVLAKKLELIVEALKDNDISDDGFEIYWIQDILEKTGYLEEDK